MSYTTTDRDPADDGIIRTPPRVAGRTPRRPITLTEGSTTVPRPDTTRTYYGLDGKVVDGPAKAAAMVEADPETGRTTYSVRASAYGSDRGRFLDPLGFLHKPEDLTGFDPRSGHSKYEFRNVDQVPFRDYLHYLLNRTSEFLRRAERAVLNG